MKDGTGFSGMEGQKKKKEQNKIVSENKRR